MGWRVYLGQRGVKSVVLHLSEALLQLPQRLLKLILGLELDLGFHAYLCRPVDSQLKVSVPLAWRHIQRYPTRVAS